MRNFSLLITIFVLFTSVVKAGPGDVGSVELPAGKCPNLNGTYTNKEVGGYKFTQGLNKDGQLTYHIDQFYDLMTSPSPREDIVVVGVLGIVNKEAVAAVSPDKAWCEDGTIIVLFRSYDGFLSKETYTLDTNGDLVFTFERRTTEAEAYGQTFTYLKVTDL